jgi:tetratricopeptide (TPR) repeat protein
MPHPSRGLPARSLLLWTLAIAGAGLTGFVSTAEPTASATPLTGSAESSDPASWPRFALHEARLAAAQLDHAHRRVQALEQIAAATTGLGDCPAARTILAEALGTAREIADVALRDLALRDIAKRQAACADVAAALATLAEIDSRSERNAVSIAVVSAQVAADELPQALQVAGAIDDPVMMSEAQRMIAVAQARRGRMNEAREIAGRIPDFLVRAMASADIAALHADIGNAQALNSARLIARATPNARQRDVALSYVAGVQAQSGDVRSALGTSAAIKDGTSKAYALARIAAARAGTVDDAAVPELLDRAFSAARRAKPTGATAAVLCEIAQGYMVRGDVAQARSVVDHAYTIATSKRGLRYGVGVVEKIARLRARMGDIASALAIAEGIPDGSSRALLVHDILAAQAEKDDVAGAIRAANALTDARLQVAALFGIVGVQMTSGDSAGARTSLRRVLELARETPDLGFRSHSLGAVAAAQVELGDRTDAWPIFQDALAAAAALPDAYARAYAYVNLSDPFTQRP